MRKFGSDRERRRRRANALYEFEVVLREECISDFVYDEGKDLFRFPDGKFAFSREWADVDLLQERGYFGGAPQGDQAEFDRRGDDWISN